MTTEEKLLKMYVEIHGEVTGSCSLEIWEDDSDYSNEELGVKVMKDGDLCFTVSKTDLLFDYVTKEWSK